MKKLLGQVTFFVYLIVFSVTAIDARFLTYGLEELSKEKLLFSYFLAFCLLFITWGLFLATLVFRSFFANAAQDKKQNYLFPIPVFMLGAVLIAIFASEFWFSFIFITIFLLFALSVFGAFSLPVKKFNPPV